MEKLGFPRASRPKSSSKRVVTECVLPLQAVKRNPRFFLLARPHLRIKSGIGIGELLRPGLSTHSFQIFHDSTTMLRLLLQKSIGCYAITLSEKLVQCQCCKDTTCHSHYHQRKIQCW